MSKTQNGSKNVNKERWFQPPIIIYVAWHPSFQDGASIGNSIYSQFCRDITQPTSRGIGIPVYFRYAEFHNKVPRPILLDAAAHSIVFVLVDDNMVVDQDWEIFLNETWDLCEASGGRHRMLPIQLSSSALRVSKKIAAANFIRLASVADRDELLIRLTHEVCRLLYGKARVAEASVSDITEASPQPIALFISHAKRDGETTAKRIRDYIHATLPLKTFFDTYDIAPGFSFKNEIDAGIEHSALLVIQSDAYSSREWCQHEVMWAKRRRRPVVIINALENGEKRSFPYCGNVPTIRWIASDSYCQKAVGMILLEVLRHKHFLDIYSIIVQSHSISKKCLPFPSTPELLTCVHILAQLDEERILVYPDPPLGSEEIELLKEFSPKIIPLTPTLLAVEVS